MLKGLATKQERDDFLQNVWQQNALLLKSALPGFADPISADDLAGLALDDDVDCRLVSDAGKNAQFGPFTTEELNSFPARDATLLVRGVDTFDEEVAGLLDHFRFLPRWRLEDIMVSFASPGGGVGPHFDEYDVFLIQGQGSRRWRIGQKCDASTAVDCDGALRTLKHFETVAEYELKAGDILYVPPGVAHWGEAISNSLCYSVGFRAPSWQEALLELGESSGVQGRYKDPVNALVDRKSSHTEIDSYSVNALQKGLQGVIADENALAEVLGILQSRSLFEDNTDSIDSPLHTQDDMTRLIEVLSNEGQCYFNAQARRCFSRLSGQTKLYCKGFALNARDCDIEWVQLLCENECINAAQWQRFCLDSSRMAAHQAIIVELMGLNALDLS